MPRKARIKSSMGIYHIILRSVNQQIIFEEEADFLKFLYLLSNCKEKYDFDIFAYCIMSNHIHLLISDYNNQLSSIFQSLETRFARWYNQKYNRSGHLFQDRFFSSPISDINYFINVFVYIHNNPVKNCMCRYPTEYRWSSARAYYGQKDNLIKLDNIFEIVGSKENLKTILSSEDNNSNNNLIEIYKSQPRYYNDKYALDIFKQISNCNSPSDVQRLSKVDRNRIIRMLIEKKLSYSQIARFCGITKTTVYRIARK